MTEQVVGIERRGHVTVLTMNHRPYNLMGPTLMVPLLAALRDAVEQGSRAVVLRSGLRHFCAGADVHQFEALMAAAKADSSGEKSGGSDKKSSFGEGANFDPVETLRAFENLPIPIVTSIHGACVGGGLEMALASDYVVAAASAKLGSVESALGLHPLMGGIQREVQRLGMARGKEMAMLGRRYDAETLERWGLINLVVPDDKLEEATMTVAQELANGPTVAHRVTKQIAAIAASQGVEAADLAMGELQKAIWASKDVMTGLESFLKNGPGQARFEGV